MMISLAGGALIGLAASLLLLAHGQVAGISGILGGLLQRPPTQVAYRSWFLFGLVAAGILLRLFRPESFGEGPGLLTAGIAGLLVGFGSRLGNGCTSGHGVCGISRLSPRSLVATVTFISTGAIGVLLQ